MAIKAYLRASTRDQDPTRAKRYLRDFADAQGVTIAAYYIEQASGTRLDRPELMRLLDEAAPGDVLLVEAVDRLTRLPQDAWRALRSRIEDKGVRVVSVDLPTSHAYLTPAPEGDAFQSRVLDAVGSMMLDILAAVAEADYQTRRRRQAEGIVKAREQGVVLGRPSDPKLHATIRRLRCDGESIRNISRILRCSTTTVQKAIKAESA